MDIELAKKIPTAAGLGGGSSDAAATIAGVRQLLDLPWTLEEMSRLGAQLGSDVPFFLSGPSALIRGWGQDVSPLSITGDRWIVLVNPGFPIETKWAYDRLTTMREIICPVSSRLREIESKGSLAWDEVIDLMENDFEPVLFETFPMLEKLKVELCALGAETALLSGSGATVFGVFPDQRTAQEAVQVLEENKQHSVFAVRAGSGSVKREA